jgi:hypothetical protein
MSKPFDLKKWAESVKPGQYSYQTVHPKANRTVAELQDIANAAEASGTCLQSTQFTGYEWEIIIQIVLAIRDLPEMSRQQISMISTTDELIGIQS